MKILLLTLPVLIFAAACNNDLKKNFEKEKQEASRDYREEINQAREDKNEAIQDAREDYHDEQREEAIENVKDSKGVDLKKDDH